MRVLNVNSTLNLKIGGGNAERTFQMSRHFPVFGVVTTVLALDINIGEQEMKSEVRAKVVLLPCLWKRFYFPLSGFLVIQKLVNDSDIIHLMGHWSILNALVYIAIRRARKPYVVCPAGALPLFGRSRRLKQLYNFIIGKRIICNASGWIAVTASRITVIPNGIHKKDFLPIDTKNYRRSKGLADKPIILFMGRLNPIKGPDLLLRAFAIVRRQLPDYQLVFAGPDEGMQTTLMEMAEQEGIIERVHFLGFVAGDEKSAAYRMANLLVIPSRQEAMSIVALEAGICGTPVLLTDQCGFSEIKTIDPGLEVPATAEGIAEGLMYLYAKRDSIEEIASSFEKFVSERYSWNLIIEKHLNLYQDILKNSAR
jgi:glycosyltransferase involved in cell wall biosynthesis